jgi:uncharacterized membrane protein
MKKLLSILAIVILFASMSTVTSVSLSAISTTGTFEGNIGYRTNGSWVPIGNISGSYTDVGWLGYRWGGFNGNWSINNGNTTGSMQGRFRLLIIGRISTVINGTQRQLPIIGFLGSKPNGEFLGRVMSYVGPALYFWGNYQLD